MRKPKRIDVYIKAIHDHLGQLHLHAHRSKYRKEKTLEALRELSEDLGMTITFIEEEDVEPQPKKGR